MTDRPIIFSAPMVRALLDGRKTQTRRLYKVPAGSYVEQGRVWAMTDGCAYGDAALPYAPGDQIIPCIEIRGFGGMYASGADGCIWSFAKDSERRLVATVPKGKGYPSVSLLRPSGKTTRKSVHRLVCEAFHGAPPSSDHECRHLDGNPENGRPSNLWWGTREENWQDRKAHGNGVEGEKHHAAKLPDADRAHIAWAVDRGLCSQRHAARVLGMSQAAIWAICNPSGIPSRQDAPDLSRFDLTLIVTEVRVQRLQDISAADSIAEGVECDTCTAMGQSACHGRGCFASIDAYRHLWNSLHGPDAWGANPWVVAVGFTVETKNIDNGAIHA